MAKSHCTSVIKLIKDKNQKIKDLIIGHTTWDD
jgi:hypothetical protein